MTPMRQKYSIRCHAVAHDKWYWWINEDFPSSRKIYEGNASNRTAALEDARYQLKKHTQLVKWRKETYVERYDEDFNRIDN